MGGIWGKQRQIKKSINKLIDEQKTKYIDVYRIFANEYIERINENKTLQKCTFLMKVKNYIINAK